MAATNPYLEGNYGPVSEEVTATDLRVQGHIPDALCGRYVRNGPNPIVAPAGEIGHPAGVVQDVGEAERVVDLPGEIGRASCRERVWR